MTNTRRSKLRGRLACTLVGRAIQQMAIRAGSPFGPATHGRAKVLDLLGLFMAFLLLTGVTLPSPAATLEELKEAARAAARAARESLSRKPGEAASSPAMAPAASAPTSAPQSLPTPSQSVSGVGAERTLETPTGVDLNFGVVYHPRLKEDPKTGGREAPFVDPFGLCEASRLREGAVNLVAERDFDAQLRRMGQMTQYAARLLLYYGNREAETLADFPGGSGSRRVDCLARIMSRYPELSRTHYTYFTILNGAVLRRTGPPMALLRDGAHLVSPGRQLVIAKLTSDELAKLDLVARSGFGPDLLASNTVPPSDRASPPVEASIGALPILPAGSAAGRATGELRFPLANARTFGISEYEVVAIKHDGSVEARDIRRGNNPLDPSRTISSVRDAVWIKSNATMKAPGLGTLSLVKTASGQWFGWAPNGDASEVGFGPSLERVIAPQARRPSDHGVMDVAAGSNGLLWLVYGNGSVMMTAGNGLFPNPEALAKQVKHRFTRVRQVSAVPWSGGSQHAVFLKADGTIWANSARFVLGWLIDPTIRDEAGTQIDPAWAPGQVRGVEDAIDMAVNWTFGGKGKGVAVLKDGGVVSMAFDRRADSSAVITSSSIYADARPVKLPARAKRAAAGGGAVGVLDELGRVWVWGSDPDRVDAERRPLAGFRGQRITPEFADRPMLVEGISGAIDIFFGPTLAGALLQDGSVWVWNSSTPVKVFEGVKLPQ